MGLVLGSFGRASTAGVARTRSHPSTLARQAALAVIVPILLCVALLGTTSASAACPNEVFRTGPSATLPDCRAYELISPRYTGGITPTFTTGAISEAPNAAESEVVSADGTDITYNTDAGTFSGFPGTGDVDRYSARRTADGWVNELLSPHGYQVSSGSRPEGSSPGHSYFFQSAIDPDASLWAPWGGMSKVNLLRTPKGFEPLARGSLGDDTANFLDGGSYGPGKMITENATHVYFVSMAHLEPLAAPAGMFSVYDRTPGGPTKVVSLLPGNQPTTEGSYWLGATNDGSEAAFQVGGGFPDGVHPMYVRRNENTYEAVRPSGVVASKVLHCAGEPGSATVEYQWLRNGGPIGGATSSSYTVAAADEGTVVQCQVTASNSDGATLKTSLTRLVEPYQEKNTPEMQQPEGIGTNPSVSTITGAQVTCGSGFDFHVSGATYTYAWLRDGVVIGGATASTYTPVDADVDKSIQCRKTATTADGVAGAYSNPVAITQDFPQASAGPAIADVTDLEAGDELTCSSGTWSGSPSFSYQWLRNGVAIGAATASTYTIAAADEGAVLQCLVSGENAAATARNVSSPVTVVPQPTPTSPVMTYPYSTGGGSTVGSSRFCAEGAWSGEPAFSRQWLRDGAPIPGATEFSYTLTPADLGTVIQCRITATNAGGAVVALEAGSSAVYVTKDVPIAEARMAAPSVGYAGIFNGHLFYTDMYSDPSREFYDRPGDLYSFDLATGRSTAITDTSDAAFVNVSEDGSHAYFARTFESGGETSGKLYVWNRADDSTTPIGDLSGEDVTSFRSGEAGLVDWTRAIGPAKANDIGRGMNHTRSTADGTVLAFEATTQLTAFDNIEATPATCTKPEEEDGAQELCEEVYRYDAESEQLTCVSCGPGPGPATGEAQLYEFGNGVFAAKFQVTTALTPPRNLSEDGSTLVFESSAALVPRDTNNQRDIYRWEAGKGVALISSGQNANSSALFGVSRDGGNIVFGTREQLLPQDENGAGIRLYDARVNGGFPPPEDTVTEPCAADVCQGAPSAGPEAPRIASSALNGTGNVEPKLHCGEGKGRVRHGRERCVTRRHRKRHQQRRAGGHRRTAR